jgi:hypothetical protein
MAESNKQRLQTEENKINPRPLVGYVIRPYFPLYFLLLL